MKDYLSKGNFSNCEVNGRFQKIAYFQVLWSLMSGVFFGVNLAMEINERQSEAYEDKDDGVADVRSLKGALLGITIMFPQSVMYSLLPLTVRKEDKKFWLTCCILFDIPCTVFSCLSAIALPTAPIIFWFVAYVYVFVAKLCMTLCPSVCMKIDQEQGLRKELEPFAKHEN